MRAKHRSSGRSHYQKRFEKEVSAHRRLHSNSKTLRTRAVAAAPPKFFCSAGLETNFRSLVPNYSEGRTRKAGDLAIVKRIDAAGAFVDGHEGFLPLKFLRLSRSTVRLWLTVDDV